MSRSSTDSPIPHDEDLEARADGQTDATAVDGAGAEVTVTRGAEPSPGWSQRLRSLDGRTRIAVLAVLLLVAGVTTWWMLQRDDLPEGAAFRLGDQVVTGKQVDRRVDALEALYGVKPPEKAAEKSDFLRDAAKSMAVQLMLEDEADERGLVIAAKEVDDTLQTIVERRYPEGGRTEFVQALGELGATEEQVRDEIGNQLLVSKLFDDVAGDVTVTDAELKATFEERRDELATPVRRSLRNIVVADRDAARDVVRQLRGGMGFAAVARSSSLDSSTRDAGGALGEVAEADLEKEYAQAAFAAPVGGLFGPVRTESGWNVGMVERELPGAPAKFAVLRDALRQTVLAEKSLEKWRAWLADVIGSHEVDYAEDYRPDDRGAVPDIDQADITGGQ